MYKLFFFILFLCFLNLKPLAQIPDLIPFNDGKTWGYMRSSDKSVIIQPQFEVPSFFQNGKAIVIKNSKYGLIDMQGNYSVPLKYDWMAACGSNQNYIIKKGQYYGIINQKDSVIFPINNRDFSTGNLDTIIYSHNNKKKGVVLSSGQILIKPQYDELHYYNNKAVFLFRRKKESGYLYADGKLKISSKQVKKGEFVGYPVIKYKDIYFLVNQKGKKISKDYNYLSDSFGKFFQADNSEDGKHNYIDSTGKELREILGIEYEDVYLPIFTNMIVVKNTNKYGIFNYDGQLIIPFIYEDIDVSGRDYIAVKKEGKWGVIDKQNRELIIPKYEKILTSKDINYMAVKSFNSGWNCLDIKNKRKVIADDYDNIYFLNFDKDILIAVQKNKKWGVFDKTGKLILPIKYYRIGGSRYDYALIMAFEQEGDLGYYVDLQGNEYILPK